MPDPRCCARERTPDFNISPLRCNTIAPHPQKTTTTNTTSFAVTAVAIVTTKTTMAAEMTKTTMMVAAATKVIMTVAATMITVAAVAGDHDNVVQLYFYFMLSILAKQYMIGVKL